MTGCPMCSETGTVIRPETPADGLYVDGLPLAALCPLCEGSRWLDDDGTPVDPVESDDRLATIRVATALAETLAAYVCAALDEVEQERTARYLLAELQRTGEGDVVRSIGEALTSGEPLVDWGG